MTEQGIEAVTWRGKKCGCLLLQASVSPEGWRIVLPQPAGDNLPNRGSAIPGGWTENPGDEWVRYPDRGRLVWQMPLDHKAWAGAAVTVTHERPAHSSRPGRHWEVNVGEQLPVAACRHGYMQGELADLVADVAEFRTRHKKVARRTVLR